MVRMLWEDRAQGWASVPIPLKNRSFPTPEKGESLWSRGCHWCHWGQWQEQRQWKCGQKFPLGAGVLKGWGAETQSSPTRRLRRWQSGSPSCLQPCNNVCRHSFSSVTLHAVITTNRPGKSAETLPPAVLRVQQSPGMQLAQPLRPPEIPAQGSGLRHLFQRQWSAFLEALAPEHGNNQRRWGRAGRCPGTLGWSAAAALWVSSPGHRRHPCGGRVPGQGGFAGIVQGLGHLLRCLNTLFVHSPHPWMRKALLFSVISKSPSTGASASVAGDAEKKPQRYSGKK